MNGKAEKLVKKIAGHTVIGLDACFFIYQLEDHPTYADLCSPILDLLEDGKVEAVTSSITLSEILAHPYKLHKIQEVFEIDQAIRNIPNLSIIPVDAGEARLAAYFRGKQSMRLPDCIHLACAVSREAEVFITNDHRLTPLGNIEVIYLSDFVD